MSNLSDVSLQSDNVFGDGWDAELATVTGEPAGGVTVSITIGVAEKSANTESAPATPPAGGPGGRQPPMGSRGR